MEILKRYISGTQKIVIAKYPNGKFYNIYGWSEEWECGSAGSAGGFETIEEAEKMLKKHRPTAQKVQ